METRNRQQQMLGTQRALSVGEARPAPWVSGALGKEVTSR